VPSEAVILGVLNVVQLLLLIYTTHAAREGLKAFAAAHELRETILENVRSNGDEARGHTL
jgi:hypothetical protein